MHVGVILEANVATILTLGGPEAPKGGAAERSGFHWILIGFQGLPRILRTRQVEGTWAVWVLLSTIQNVGYRIQNTQCIIEVYRLEYSMPAYRMKGCIGYRMQDQIKSFAAWWPLYRIVIILYDCM